MSDTAQGPGWWLASDGKWYPPELWTGPPAAGPAVTRPGTVVGAGRTGPAAGLRAGATPGAQPYSGRPTESYGSAVQPGAYRPYGQPMAYGGPAQKTNGLAVASLICSCAGILVIPSSPG